MELTQQPARAGFDPRRWAGVTGLIADWCAAGSLPAATLLVVRPDVALGPFPFGRQRIARDSPPLTDDAIFLVASITKPVVATGVLRLIEQGVLTLGDRIGQFLPGFPRHGKVATTIRHLLTHTSGLPDQLPDNQELRAAQSPLSVFVERTCGLQPEFPPGRGVQYQSMGYAILGAVIERVTGLTCAEYLRRELFEPLGMRDTALGAPEDWFAGPQPRIARVPEVRVPRELESATDWNWNSRYWRTLGAPWGGMLCTATDLGRFAQMMLNSGRVGEGRYLSGASIDAATRNQLDVFRDLPESERRGRPWGLGWRLNWPAHSANFGDLVGPRTYGHWGATGTVLWIDPDRQLAIVFLTTQSQEPDGWSLARLSNRLLAALD